MLLHVTDVTAKPNHSSNVTVRKPQNGDFIRMIKRHQFALSENHIKVTC